MKKLLGIMAITALAASAFAQGTISISNQTGKVQQWTSTAINYAWPVGLNAAANVIPVSTNFPGNTVGNSFDSILLWDRVGGGWNTDWQYYGFDQTTPDPPLWSNGGVTDIGGPDNVNGPLLDPGTGFFYQNVHGPTVSFTRSFTVQ
jgi:hypothetical protein